MAVSSTRERLARHVVRWMPKSTYGKVVGFGARRTLPRALRRSLFQKFAARYGVNLDEVERPLEDYPSFDAFFTRHLRSGVRPIDSDPSVAVSPVDGVVVESGVVSAGRLLQAKGIDYTLRGLLIDSDMTNVFAGGSYVTLYLAPRDYHRIHAPADGKVLAARHIPGAFFPVNPPAVRNIPGLFSRNERLVTYLDTPLGKIAVVKVAAAGVGHVTTTYDPEAQTRRSRSSRRMDYSSPKTIAKGEELATFHLGSTVIVLFEGGRVVLHRLEKGQRMMLGQALAQKAGASAGDAAA